MLDSETVIQVPHDATVTRVRGKKQVEVHDRRVSVSMRDRGVEIVFFFDDLSGEGPVREIRLLPDKENLSPHVLRRLMPQSALYARYARAAMQFKAGEAREALKALRDLGSTRRGLGDDLYRIVAHNYMALLADGERYPVKALAGMHYVSEPTASRWIKGARERGYIPDREAVPA